MPADTDPYVAAEIRLLALLELAEQHEEAGLPLPSRLVDTTLRDVLEWITRAHISAWR
jgi:hypothetical protein